MRCYVCMLDIYVSSSRRFLSRTIGLSGGHSCGARVHFFGNAPDMEMSRTIQNIAAFLFFGQELVLLRLLGNLV